LAGVAFDEGDARRAALYLGAADALRRAAATPVPPVLRAGVDELVTEVRSAIGDEAFAEEWTVGQSLTAEAAIDIALESP